MSQWNLSVQLTGQGSDLKATLRDGAKEARKLKDAVNDARQAITALRAETANPITVRLAIDGANLRRDVDAALSAAGDGQGITIPLRVDGGNLRSEVDAALAAAGGGQGITVPLRVDGDSLRDEVNAALTTAGSGQGMAVNLALTDTMQLRRDVQNAVRWAAWGHRIEIPIGLRDPNALRRDVTAAVRRASLNQTIRIRTTTDTSALRGGGSTGGAGAAAGAAGGLGEALTGLLTLAPAAIPLIAGLAANLAPVVAQFGTAGVAGAAFGLAIAGQIGPLGEAADAQKKYEDAVTQYGKSSKQAREAAQAYRIQIASLPPATQKAAAALSILKSDFGDWSDDMSEFTMDPVTRGMSVIGELLPHLSPEVKSFSAELGRLVDVAGGAVQTPGFDAMSDRFADFSASTLRDITNGVIHFMRVVGEGGEMTGPLGSFIDYARENGPEARQALSALADAVSTLVEGAAQAGPGMLALVTAILKLVAAMPPELVAVILQVAAALKLIALAGAGYSAVSGAVTTLSGRLTTLRATSTAAGGGIVGLRAALASLSTGAKIGLAAAAVGALVLVLHELSDNKPAVEVDALSTSLNTLLSTGKVTGALKSNFREMSESIAMVSKGASDNKLAQMTSDFGAWVGIAKGPSISTARENVDAWDKSMAQLVKSGHPKEAAAQYNLLKNAWKAGGGDMDRLKGSTNDYNDALADQKFEAQMAADSMGIFGEQAQQVQADLAAQKSAADGLIQSLQALNEVNRAGGSAMAAFEQSIDDVKEAVGKHATALKMANGELNLGSEGAREAEKALSTLAANTDAATTAAIEQGKSWEHVNGIYKRGRQAFIDSADAMGLTKAQAKALADAYIDIPDSKTTLLKMQAEDATRDLKSFNAALAASPGSKSVTLKTLSTAAEKILESFGYKVKRLPDGSVTVTAKTGQALSGVRDIAGAIAALQNRTVTITTIRRTIATSNVSTRPGGGEGGESKYADGAIVDYYAQGGIQRGGVRHFAAGSENHVAQIAPAGSWRVWGEPETGGEAYVPFAMSKRPRSRKIAEETVRRLGGDPNGIDWYASGGGMDFNYQSTGGQASKYTISGLISASNDKKGNFSLAIFTAKLKSSNNALSAWRKDLATVASRAGQDVADALAEMGDDGIALTKKMAHGSNAYIKSMTKELENLAAASKASLGEYTSQLKDAVKDQTTFQNNLAKLAGQGYGDLATRLAAQGDQAAEELAASAVRDPKKAKSANSASKSANNALTSEQIEQLVAIIAAVTTSKTGIHNVAATTGLGEDDIITVGNKAKAQIKSSLGSRSTTFLSDLGKANRGMAYADGGIRSGIYATQNGAVTFAEPSTGGEAFIPLGGSKRRSALPVLGDVAARFGLGLTDAGAGRPVVIVQGGDTVTIPVTAVRTGASASDIGSQVGRSYRRARRGGVASRAGS